jgi:WD40 repeat protein
LYLLNIISVDNSCPNRNAGKYFEDFRLISIHETVIHGKNVYAIWNLQTGKCDTIYTPLLDRCFSLLSNGRIFGQTCRLSSVIMNPQNNKIDTIYTEDSKDDYIRASYITYAYMLHDERIITRTIDGILQIWSKNKQCDVILEGYTKITCVAELPDGRIICGSFNDTLKIWNVITGKCDNTLVGHIGPMNCVIALPDGRIVSGSVDKTIKIWS